MRKGKLTLPILYLLQNTDSAERDAICQIILSGTDAEIATLVTKAVETGALKSAVATGRRMLGEARVELDAVAPGRYREALEGLVTTLDAMFSQYGAQGN